MAGFIILGLSVLLRPILISYPIHAQIAVSSFGLRHYYSYTIDMI